MGAPSIVQGGAQPEWKRETRKRSPARSTDGRTSGGDAAKPSNSVAERGREKYGAVDEGVGCGVEEGDSVTQTKSVPEGSPRSNTEDAFKVKEVPGAIPRTLRVLGVEHAEV